jgi:hypothetical protein
MYAKALLAGNPKASGSFWLERGEWCCTAFTIKTSGIFIAVLEPSVFGTFALFSVIGYLGVLAFAVALWRAFPAIPAERFLLWLMLFPSLWYWPAALGKDALMIAGIGIAVLGYVGRRERTSWFILSAGAALVFAVRPQVAVVLLFAFAAGHWLFVMRDATVSRLQQGILIAAIGIGVLLAAEYTMNVTFTDAGEVGEYLVRTQSGVSRMGGASVGTGRLNPLTAAINVLMRPFLWEARSVTSLMAAFEITCVWFLAWWQRRKIIAFVRVYKGHRVLWMAIIFIATYAVAMGLASGNLGVIARQRIHIFPFLFIFLAGPPIVQRVNRHRVGGLSPISRTTVENRFS